MKHYLLLFFLAMSFFSFSQEMEAWEQLYKTVNTEELRSQLPYRVHKKISAKKGWEFKARKEAQFIDSLKVRLVDIPPAITELAAWDNLYCTVNTEDLRTSFSYRVHRKYAERSGVAIYARKEKDYINVLKEKQCTGSGSSITQVNPVDIQPSSRSLAYRSVANPELEAWGLLYATVNTEELRSKLAYKVHKLYAARRGWEFKARKEADYIDSLKYHITIQPANTELEAWENLYCIINTPELADMFAYGVHRLFAERINRAVKANSEKKYIDTLKKHIGCLQVLIEDAPVEPVEIPDVKPEIEEDILQVDTVPATPLTTDRFLGTWEGTIHKSGNKNPYYFALHISKDGIHLSKKAYMDEPWKSSSRVIIKETEDGIYFEEQGFVTHEHELGAYWMEVRGNLIYDKEKDILSGQTDIYDRFTKSITKGYDFVEITRRRR